MPAARFAGTCRRGTASARYLLEFAALLDSTPGRRHLSRANEKAYEGSRRKPPGEGFVSSLAGARSLESGPRVSFPAHRLHSIGMPQQRVASEGHNNKEFGL